MRASSQKHSPLAHHSPVGVAGTESGQSSPQHNSSAGSGTYFRAVRPTDAEAVALSRGEPVLDGEKIERLRSLLGALMWRADADLIAERMLGEAIG